jgi:hypothetical protein
MIKYYCTDPRQFIYRAGSSAAKNTYSHCKWRKAFNVNVTELECRIHHCAHPHLHQGLHEPPPPANRLTLVTPRYWTLAHWHISFGSSVTYTCPSQHYFELPEPSVVTPTQRTLAVKCLTSGTYAIPPLSSKLWPNCTATVLCGQPPDWPRNGSINGTFGFDGSITWLSGAADLQDTYNTKVEYRCANGSQFDTDDDGKGDKVFLQSRCQWDKTWSLASLPPCHVTHCVAPYPVPGDTALEALTAAWTMVGDEKEHRCQDPIGGVPTMFWESDRTKSTFSMTCLSDGTYQFEDIRENWPTCIQGWRDQYGQHFKIFLFQTYSAMSLHPVYQPTRSTPLLLTMEL